MKITKLMIMESFLSAAGTFFYVLAVAALMFYGGEKFFGKMDNFLGPASFLLLFVLSAAVTASLVLWKPITLFWNGMKETAIKLFFCTIAWLFILTVSMFLIMALIQNKF